MAVEMVEGDNVAELRKTFPLGNDASGMTSMLRLGYAANAAVLVCWTMRHEMFRGGRFELPFGLGLARRSRATNVVVISVTGVCPNVPLTIRHRGLWAWRRHCCQGEHRLHLLKQVHLQHRLPTQGLA